MQGTLLGSLYGNLPAPKSGPFPSPVVTEASVPESSTAPKLDEPHTNHLNLTAQDLEQKKTSILGVTGNLLLLPPPQRRRDPAQKRDRDANLLLNSSLKRIKDGATVTLENIVPSAAISGPAAPVIVRVAEESKPCTSGDAISVSSIQSQGHGEQFCPLLDSLSCSLPQKLINEYDPSKPNSYDEFVRERARYHRRKEEARRQKEEMERLREEQKIKAANAMITPSLSISGDEAWNRRRQLSTALFGESTTSADSLPSTAAPPSDKGRGFAQKMLEKMGWKHGEGLGKEKQGIIAPLVARKTDKHSGVIIQGNALSNMPPSTVSGSISLSPPDHPTNDSVTRIVLLTNLVGAGEVDLELESETTEEAAKFGNLLAVKIVEVPNVPDDQGVRIFCEYESPEAAIKARASFNGRLFGGRSVKARFYPEKLYCENALTEVFPKE